MSQRYNRKDGNARNNNSKPQMKFVPKNQNPPTQNPSPTSFSSSLRQSMSSQTDAAQSSSGGATADSTSRLRMGEGGDWVSSKRAVSGPGGNFVNYLPQDEAVAAGLGADEGGLDTLESQRVVDLLNRELSRLLKLNPREFWKEVAADTSLHEFLDSFLQFRSRWYDFPHRGAKGMVAGVLVGELELSRRVFMVLYRLSSNKDPGARAADSLSAKDHAVLLQEKKLLDLPKLLDVCAIFGHENENLTKLLVENALRSQPAVHNDFTGVLSHFLSIIHTMHQRCSSSLEVLFSSGSCEGDEAKRLRADFLEVMDFINDAVSSMDSLVASYKSAALFFSYPVEMSYGNDELLTTLARLHDSLLPSLQRGFKTIITPKDELSTDISISLKMLSSRIVNLGWKLLNICYLSDEVIESDIPIPAATKMFPANVEDPSIRADILIQGIREINGVSLQVIENQKGDNFLQDVEKNHNIMGKLEGLQNSGWINMDDEQFQYLSGIMMHTGKSISEKQTNVQAPRINNEVKTDENAAIIESEISQVKDLFPDYGKGYIAACLEVYNHNPEEVIQRILEGTLHEELLRLNTSLETMPLPKSSSTLDRKDKGKGKVVDSETTPSTNIAGTAAKQPVNGPPISSSTTVGRFVRKSKDVVPDHVTLNTRERDDELRKAALVAQYEYDDEYDDSFDELGLGGVESGFDERESFRDRNNSDDEKSGVSGSGNSTQPSASSKWGSRQKPQYYVKDGKNYSYKVTGSVAVANANEASLLNQVHSETIHGLGRGGNHPLGAVKKWTQHHERDSHPNVSETAGSNTTNPSGRGMQGRGRGRGHQQREVNAEENQSNGRGRGRGFGRGHQHREVNEEENQSDGRGRGRGFGRGHQHREVNEEENQSDGPEMGGRGSINHRGGGRRGGGRNTFRKDRAMHKHFSGLGGH